MRLVKALSLLATVCMLAGCATWDWSFNKQHERAQLILDNYRHVQLKLEQGQLP
jgi:uncharacterized lipoprotein YajG